MSVLDDMTCLELVVAASERRLEPSDIRALRKVVKGLDHGATYELWCCFMEATHWALSSPASRLSEGVAMANASAVGCALSRLLALAAGALTASEATKACRQGRARVKQLLSAYDRVRRQA